MSRFTDRVAVVTGAACGIGRATAVRLATEGARVAVVDRDAAGAAHTAEIIAAAGGVALASPCDVADSASVRATARAIEAALGAVDVLANVAGIGDTAGLEGIEGVDDERWNARARGQPERARSISCRALLPGMAARGRGAVVNVSSLAGRSKSANGGLAYSSSKAGLLGLTRHLAFDYGPRGVRVNAICPGGVDTPMLRAGGVRDARSEAEAEARARAHRRLRLLHADQAPLAARGAGGGDRVPRVATTRRTSTAFRST